ncbi:MAG: type IV secretory system conjugative DNA transfer family protein [Alphaproteobacteria bacterium]|nr:type IV secretory system conjugative DNA transfer family protein [Alphaproteobacteria bacterium]
MTGVPLGYEWDMRRGRYGKAVTFEGRRAPHLLVIGPNGSGKGTRLLIPALLQMAGRSIVVIDPKGELAAVTAAWRRTLGDVVVLNPFGLHVGQYPDLASAGFNPLASLDENAPTFYDDAKGLAEALITVEGDPQRHFPESARGLITGAIMWERRLNADQASLKHVRMMLTEREEWSDAGDGKRHLVRGLRRTAELMCEAAKQFPDQGGWQIASLAARFVDEFSNETRGIQSTLDTQTGWILSEPLASDLERNGIDFRRLKQKPSTVYVILPGERLREHAIWLRLVIAWALRGLYSPGGVPVLFIMDEFAQLGRLGPIEDALGQGRGYGIALLPVLQDINQLRDLYKERAETFAGMSGAVFGFPPNDMNTAKWMSERSGEETIVGMSAGESDAGDGPRVNYHPQIRPRYTPADLFNLPEGHGLVWAAGSAEPQPIYAPPYWDIARCRKRARQNPYHP